MRVIIDEEKCVAGGQCVFAAPDVFDQRDEDGIVVLLNAEPDEAEREAVENAILLCPAAAIWLDPTAEQGG